MSFTTDVKAELCGCDLTRHGEKTVLYGFLYCLKEQNGYFTDNAFIKDYLCKIAGEAVNAVSVRRRGRDGFFMSFDGKALNVDISSPDISGRFVDGRDENTGLFLRGAFIGCGIVADPNKEYHLEFSVGDADKCEKMGRLITESGMKIKISRRKGQGILYSKDSEAISDLLTYIGAMISSMEIMNTKIYKGVRNNVNRAVNCEAANIEKIVAASRKQLADIEYIENSEGLGLLTEELRRIAEIRRDNIELSLSEIGKMLDPPISRSGVYHRLKRISETADRLRKERGD